MPGPRTLEPAASSGERAKVDVDGPPVPARRAGWVALLLLLSCGKKDEPPPRVEASPATAPAPRPAIVLAEVPVPAGTPFTLRDLKVMVPSFATDGRIRVTSDTLELRVTATPAGELGAGDRLTILTTCRVHDVNLTFDEDRMRTESIAAIAAKQGEVEGLFVATPFAELPQRCELVLRHHTGRPGAADDRATVIAIACLHDKTLTLGACAPGSFPAPTGSGLALGPRVETVFKPGVSQITGLFTLVDALHADEDLRSTWRCTNGTKTSTTKPGADSYSFWNPRLLGAGRSAYGNVASFLEGDVDPAQCEIAFAARADGKPDRALGTWCVQKAGTVITGRCPP